MVENYEKQAGQVLELLRKFPQGASISDLLKHSEGKCTRRTLQRRLTALVHEGMIRRVGQKRAVRYFAIDHKEMKITQTEEESSYLPISEQGEEIRRYVIGPIGSRKPVGYHRNFLEDYSPNKTFYFTESEHNMLEEIGCQPNGEKPAGTFARKIFDRLLVDLSWNSSRLEGNTYSLLETERLLELGEAAYGKSALDAQMILNHKQAIEFLVESIEEIKMNSITIRNLHALLSDGLLGSAKACGKIRTIPVGISGTVFHPLEIFQLIEEFLDKILKKADAIKNPFEQSFFLMIHLPYLQPFEDVNKRVSRLMANIPLIKNNLCPLAFVDVPEHRYIEGILGVYELNRIDLLKDVFLWAYKRSSLRYSAIQHSLGNPDPFRVRYRNEIKELVREIVTNKMNKQQATKFIQDWVYHNLEKADRIKFVETIEIELLDLHVGNIQRYKVSQNQFETWQSFWSKMEH